MGLGHDAEVPNLLLSAGPFLGASCHLGIGQRVLLGAKSVGRRPLVAAPSSSGWAALEPCATARALELVVPVLWIAMPSRNHERAACTTPAVPRSLFCTHDGNSMAAAQPGTAPLSQARDIRFVVTEAITNRNGPP